MKLVKLMCATKSHNTPRSESALTIHDGVWAFCYAGGQTLGHEWQPVDGLPLNDAMRFAQPVPISRPAGAPLAALDPRTPAAGPAAPQMSKMSKMSTINETSKTSKISKSTRR